MKKFLKTDEWNIIEEGFHADKLRASESEDSDNGVILKKLIVVTVYKVLMWQASAF